MTDRTKPDSRVEGEGQDLAAAEEKGRAGDPRGLDNKR